MRQVAGGALEDDEVEREALTESVVSWTSCNGYFTVLTPVLTPLSRQVLTRTNTYFCCFNTVPYSRFPVSTLCVNVTTYALSCLILWVPLLAIGWELCVPVRTGALLAPWRVHRYRSPRTAPSRSKDMVHKSCRSTASGNDFPDADLAPLTLLGGTSARAQMVAADTAFVMAIHGATLVSIPRVLADVDPTSIAYVDGDPSSMPALSAASNVSVGPCDASWCPGLLFCK